MKSPLRVVLGVLLALTFFEGTARMATDALPAPEQWPTVETEIKSRQLAELADRGVEVDVVFVGSSVVEAGLDPDLFDPLTGVTSYNAAHPFSSPLSNEVWIEDVVLRSVEPSVMVIGLGVWPYGSTVDSDPLHAELERIASESLAPTGIALIDRRKQLRSWSDSAKRVDRVRSRVITERGYQTVYGQMTAQPDDRARFDDSQHARMSDDNLLALKRTIEMLQARSIEPVILLEPTGCPPAFDACARYDPQSHPGRTLAAEYGLAVIDATGEAWPQRFYADSAHFNRTGAEELTEFAAGAIREVLQYAEGATD